MNQKASKEAFNKPPTVEMDDLCKLFTYGEDIPLSRNSIDEFSTANLPDMKDLDDLGIDPIAAYSSSVKSPGAREGVAQWQS